MEYLTTYPKTISFFDGLRDMVKADGASGVEQLTVVVKKNVDELLKIFSKEGFTGGKFEHNRPFQIGHGFSLKLKKPWEMHVRLVEMKKGLIAIQAEVEVSRDYLQHLFCQRTPVIYEIESLMKKYQINYKIKLNTPNIPVLAWKPLVFVIATVGSFYLWKYIQTI